MFTGIIIAQSKISDVKKLRGGLQIKLARPRGWKLVKGQSINISGVCSTVTAFTAKKISVEYMPVTVKQTTASTFIAGKMVNLEPSLRLSDELGGHFVTGHVDGRGRVKEVNVRGRSKVIAITLPKRMMKLVAPQGSITVDGVSMTLVDSKKTWFTVAVVDHTLHHTSLGSLRVGDQVNIELDIIAKYLKKMVS